MNQKTKDKLADIIWYIKGQVDIMENNHDYTHPFDISHIRALEEAMNQKPTKVIIDSSKIKNHFIDNPVVTFEQLENISKRKGSVYLCNENRIAPAEFVCNYQYRKLHRMLQSNYIIELTFKF